MLRSALIALVMILMVPAASMSGDTTSQTTTAQAPLISASLAELPQFSPLVRKAYYPGCRRDCTACRNYCYATYRLNCYAAHCRNSFTLCMRDCWNNHCRGC